MKELDLKVAEKLKDLFGEEALKNAIRSISTTPVKNEPAYLASHMLAFLTILVVDGHIIIKEKM